jgi:mannan endo-1,6-alpha-mannosidase
MEATERNFTNPTGDIPGWLALTQAVYNTMWARWDDSYCGGGLRWQIFTWNSGYNYKNTISTACLYNLATRLGRYTGNETYFDVADTAYEWLVTIGFLDADNGTALIYDGAEVEDNCSSITKIEWTYNYALILSGSAYAYNATGEDKWYERANDVFQGSKVFFNDSVMYERACQASGTCNNDQRIFKSFFARALGHTEALISEFSDEIHALLVTSAAAAAQTCVGGTDGMTCGLDWSYSGWDGYYGVGEQMSALEVIQNVLVSGYGSDTPYTNTTGGSSVGDADAGLSTIGETSLDSGKLDITSGDRAGAGIITAVIISVITSGSIWMVL